MEAHPNSEPGHVGPSAPELWVSRDTLHPGSVNVITALKKLHFLPLRAAVTQFVAASIRSLKTNTIKNSPGVLLFKSKAKQQGLFYSDL